MSHKFIYAILGIVVVVLAVYVAILQVKIPTKTETGNPYIASSADQKLIVTTSPPTINNTNTPVQTNILTQTATSSDVTSDYLSTKFRVIDEFQNFNASTSVNDIDKLINQVQLVVVTNRRTDEYSNDSQCGSIYTQPTCYFFIEPLYVAGAPKHASFLGTLDRQGAFMPNSVKFIAPNKVEFHTADGDAGCFSDITWQLNLSNGVFAKVDANQGCGQ